VTEVERDEEARRLHCLNGERFDGLASRSIEVTFMEECTRTKDSGKRLS
jgi:hypothetical protein